MEAGLGQGDAETHIGQLDGALLRNARLLSAIGLHTGGMSGNARQQAARGTFDYTMGKLMIRKLRDDWTASRGGRSAWKAFHTSS